MPVLKSHTTNADQYKVLTGSANFIVHSRYIKKEHRFDSE